MSLVRKKTPPIAGTIFKIEHKGRVYRLVVVESNGRTAYSTGGIVFRSPTAAARSIARTATDGWTFWRIDAK